MPIEYAYPDRLSSADHSLQMAVLVAVVVMFLLPLAREIFRPGAMNWWDVWLGGFCLIAALCVPQAIETRALGRLRTELQLEPWMVAQIWTTNTWTSATALAYYTVLIHGGWLLSGALLCGSPRSYKVFQTLAVYLLPASYCCFPSLGHPHSVRDFSNCRNQFKQVMLALHNEQDDRGAFPPFVLGDTKTPRSWRVELLPFLDNQPLRNVYDEAQSWEAAPNEAIARKLIEPLTCPGNYRPRDSLQRYYTAVSGVVGPNTFFAEDGQTRRFQDCTDGTSNTIAIVEACGANIVWTEPRDLRLQEIEIGVNRPGFTRGLSRGLISSCHPHKRGGHVGLVDGTVRFVSEDVDPQLLREMLTINGGEPIQHDEHGQIRWK